VCVFEDVCVFASVILCVYGVCVCTFVCLYTSMCVKMCVCACVFLCVKARVI